MKELSHQDLRALLAAIETLHQDADPLTLPERTLQSVMSLIPNEITSFDGFGSDSHYSGYLWYSPAGTVSEERVGILGELVHGHPMFQPVISKHKTETAKISQYLPLAKFQETALYHEFYKHIGGDSQMMTSFNVSPQLYITCTLHRIKQDFSERDLSVLRAFAPHLIAAFRSAQIFNQLADRQTPLLTALDTIGYGIITLDAEYKIADQNLTAIKMLHEYFPPTQNLPGELLQYISCCAESYQNDEVSFPPAPLLVRKVDSLLKIRVAPEFQTRSIVIFLEEIKQPSALHLMKLGLTKREAEILLWIVKGKPDAEIARFAYISLRTVHKHRENIFNKLGVETRTAAAALVNELLIGSYRQ